MSLANSAPLKAVGVAVLAATLALSSAFATARVLRRVNGHGSHQLPAAEAWMESAAPTSPALVAHGRALFLDSCAHCHGADARGDEGPDLHDIQVSDRYIANVIARGIPHEMPSFAKKHGAADITALIAYVHALDQH